MYVHLLDINFDLTYTIKFILMYELPIDYKLILIRVLFKNFELVHLCFHLTI